MRDTARHNYRVFIYGRDYGQSLTRHQAIETSASWRRLWPKSRAYCRRTK